MGEGGEGGERDGRESDGGEREGSKGQEIMS